MYSVDSLAYAVKDLFQGGIGEHGYTADEVERLLEPVDFGALLQSVRHHALTVYACTTWGQGPSAFNYRGSELFGQRATLLYRDFDLGVVSEVTTKHYYELWLLEDMSIVPVACLSMSYRFGTYEAEYREIKSDTPWMCGVSIDLKELADNLVGLCKLCCDGKIPVYEL